MDVSCARSGGEGSIIFEIANIAIFMTARDNYFFVTRAGGEPTTKLRRPSPDNAPMNNSPKKNFRPWIVSIIALCLLGLMAWFAEAGWRDFLIGVAVLTTSAGIG